MNAITCRHCESGEHTTLWHEDQEHCPERCGGIVGHSGPHQTSDYIPRAAIEAEAVERERTRLREAAEPIARRIWENVYAALRAEGASDDHALARADTVRIELEDRLKLLLGPPMFLETK